MRIWVCVTVVALAGCGSASPVIRYTCAGEPVLANFQAGGVQITRASGQTLDLKTASAATGALYTKGTVEFWTKDKKARLTDDNAVLRCEKD